jgi:hypothetical protein
MSTANLKEKTLNVKKTFRGFHLLVQVTVVPVTDDPRNQYDYNVMHTQIFTATEHVDVHLLMSAMEKIEFDIQNYVVENIHSMYMNALKEDSTANSYNRHQLID